MNKFFGFVVTMLFLIPMIGQDNSYLPVGGAFDRVLIQKGYIVGFDDDLKLPEWVAYYLEKSELKAVTKRDDLFQFHPDVPEKFQNSPYSFRGSGYDRGHMAPSADLCWSVSAMYESFYMTNMAPQLAAFNRGVWKETEELTRNWARHYNGVYVISGSVFQPYTLSMPTGSGVEIPKQFFKIIFREEDSEAIAFLFENKKLSGNPRKYITNINTIEELTGLDFFSEFEDEKEERIESKSDASKWKFNIGQCFGTTQKGTRCKRKVSGGNKYCYQHKE